MRDRIQFDHIKLHNGIDCYVNPLPIDYTTLFIEMPVGHVHNTDSVIPGSYHFLEHICHESSTLYPQASAFGNAVGFTGGNSNARTSMYYTAYDLSVPNFHFDELLPGLFSQVFEPAMPEEVITMHRGIVSNERRRKERWYPGGNEIAKYESTEWKDATRCSIYQIFGSDDDLAAMNRETLSAAHRAYFDTRVRVMAVGPGNLQPLFAKLEQLPVKQHHLPQQIEPLSWKNKEYHVQQFRDTSRYTLTVGGFIQPVPDMATVRKLRFILGYITNSTHGILFDWLRRELGWAYHIGWSAYNDEDVFDWEIEMPLNNLEQIEVARAYWREKVVGALQDKQAVQKEVDKLIGASAYWNETPEGILSSAHSSLKKYGRIVHDNEWRELISECADNEALLELFAQHFSEEATGCYSAIPLEE